MTREEFGDWQTPLDLANAALEVACRESEPPASVLEPTCGEGAFLTAAAARFRRARLVGYEINHAHAERARARLPASRARVEVADFFAVDWEQNVAALPEPILVIGNPPWVTNASLGALGSSNVPRKHNFKRLSGLDARTGKSNFDVSEWMLLRLIEALKGRRATVAVLCKTAVARRVIELTTASIAPGGLWRIDAQRHFDAAVDAVLFVCKVHPSAPGDSRWPVYESLDARAPSSTMAIVGGVAVADSDRHDRTAHLAGTSTPEWRSGLKHDCARVMELERTNDGWMNGMGARVEIEDAMLYPLLKSSDVANGAPRRSRAVIVPQRMLGEDTSLLAQAAPKAWAYLCAHRDLLGARKSSIYRGQPAFAIFGVGPYSFAPWKVAISGLYKRCAFSLVGPMTDRPVMLDDTCYFLPFEAAAPARATFEALSSPLAQDFFAARIFWDAKRPISKAVLQQLDLTALFAELRV
ncbi:MAG TPA: hypothetical protein VM925_32450 [Labilithrix sp.]|nr:hypothetical protein [Labilithrix sp.]